MHDRFCYSRLLAAAALIGVPGLALAQNVDDTFAEVPSSSQWGLGVGVASQRSPYNGYGNKTDVLPIVLYNSPSFRFFGVGLDWKAASLGTLDFTLRAKYSGDGYKSGDAPEFNGMEQRKGGIWVGGTVSWRAPWAGVSMEVLSATGDARGQTVKLGLDHSIRTGRMTVTPHFSADWLSADYVDLYYGVRQNESTVNRAAYVGKSTVNTNAGVRVDYLLSPKQVITVDAGVKRYGAGITDSPLVDRTTTPTLRVGYLYNF